MWLQQDGAPPHFHRDVKRYLDTVYANKWIGRGSINPWPPRSFDATRFYGELSKSVFTKHLSTVEKTSNIE
jgi:hypothetical protein